jgi:CO/xanthine dehydrogenase Mo-binding subunit
MAASGAVGQSLKRVDAYDKAAGRTCYADDLRMEGMAFGKVLFSDRVHARIVRIDAREARALPGVIAILTADDVPVNEYGLMQNDQPVLCGDQVRSVIDRVALVIAETESVAQEARDLIRVDYEDLAAVTDPREAIKDGAPLVHGGQSNNILEEYHVCRGDTKKALAESDVVVESSYSTHSQEHAYLQPEAGLGFIDEEGRIVVHSAGQWAHDDRRQIAHALNMPEERIRVIYAPVGGAFGGREDISVQLLLALGTWKTGRPVRIVWTREESMRGHHKRHPFRMTFRTGATKEGKLTALEAEFIADAGAYCSASPAVLGCAMVQCTGPYEVPNVVVDGCAVYTNNMSSGAMRGFGSPQVLFAAELQMSKLAERLGLDRAELRRINALSEGSVISTQTELPAGVGIGETLEEVIRVSEWPRRSGSSDGLSEELPSHKRRGMGIACGWKNVGYPLGFPEQSTVSVELHGEAEIERVLIKCGAAEVGQGVTTVLPQIAAETLGIDPAIVAVANDDTSVVPNSGSASASRHTLVTGRAVYLACKKAQSNWDHEERPAAATEQYVPPPTSLFDQETGKCVPCYSYGYSSEVVQVVVDLGTGEVTLEKVYSAHDVGKAINPQLVEGQIEGGVVMGQGWVLMEEHVQRDGYPMTKTLADYTVPTIMDMPDEIVPVIVEVEDPLGPYGARGVGEMALMELAPAIVDAIHDATGLWLSELPVTAESVLIALHEAGAAMQVS